MTFLVTKQASIDLEPDKHIWTNSLDGFLSSKEAYQHLKISSNATFFGASLFGLGLPFLFDPMLWRSIHNEMAADDVATSSLDIVLNTMKMLKFELFWVNHVFNWIKANIDGSAM